MVRLALLDGRRLVGKVWNDVVMLEETIPSSFQGIVRDMTTNHSKWAVIVNSAAPYNEEMPGIWADKVSRIFHWGVCSELTSIAFASITL